MFSRGSTSEGIGEKAHTTFSRGAGSAKGARMTNVGISQVVFLPQIAPTLLLIAFGTLIIWSASLTIPEASFVRHLVGIFLGLFVAYLRLALRLPHARQHVDGAARGRRRAHAPAQGTRPRLLGDGHDGLGAHTAHRMRIQPSEPAKLVTILLMASLGAQYNGRIETLRDYLKLCGILTIPFLLILTQPDLGTGLIVLVAGASIIICAGPQAAGCSSP